MKKLAMATRLALSRIAYDDFRSLSSAHKCVLPVLAFGSLLYTSLCLLRHQLYAWSVFKSVRCSLFPLSLSLSLSFCMLASCFIFLSIVFWLQLFRQFYWKPFLQFNPKSQTLLVMLKWRKWKLALNLEFSLPNILVVAFWHSSRIHMVDQLKAILTLTGNLCSSAIEDYSNEVVLGFMPLTISWGILYKNRATLAQMYGYLRC